MRTIQTATINIINNELGSSAYRGILRLWRSSAEILVSRTMEFGPDQEQ